MPLTKLCWIVGEKDRKNERMRVDNEEDNKRMRERVEKMTEREEIMRERGDRMRDREERERIKSTYILIKV